MATESKSTTAPARKPREIFPHKIERMLEMKPQAKADDGITWIMMTGEHATVQDAKEFIAENNLVGVFRVIQVKKTFTTKKVETLVVE